MPRKIFDRYQPRHIDVDDVKPEEAAEESSDSTSKQSSPKTPAKSTSTTTKEK